MHLTKRMADGEISKLVFVVRDLDPEKIRRSFAAFGLAKPRYRLSEIPKTKKSADYTDLRP